MVVKIIFIFAFEIFVFVLNESFDLSLLSSYIIYAKQFLGYLFCFHKRCVTCFAIEHCLPFYLPT